MKSNHRFESVLRFEEVRVDSLQEDRNDVAISKSQTKILRIEYLVTRRKTNFEDCRNEIATSGIEN